MAVRIGAGTVHEICQPEGDWLFVDLGFAQDGNLSCGVWTSTGICEDMTFGCLLESVLKEARKNCDATLNLVLEAPLSVAFDKRMNPAGRFFERRGAKARYWYQNGGASTMVAAGYLLRALNDCESQRKARLFEGFVSFKKKGKKQKHWTDAKKLRDSAWRLIPACFIGEDDIKLKSTGTVQSAFKFAGMDLGIPTVIYPYINGC